MKTIRALTLCCVTVLLMAVLGVFSRAGPVMSTATAITSVTGLALVILQKDSCTSCAESALYRNTSPCAVSAGPPLPHHAHTSRRNTMSQSESPEPITASAARSNGHHDVFSSHVLLGSNRPKATVGYRIRDSDERRSCLINA